MFQNVSKLSSRSCEVLISSSWHVSSQKCRLRKSMVWSSYSSASGVLKLCQVVPFDSWFSASESESVRKPLWVFCFFCFFCFCFFFILYFIPIWHPLTNWTTLAFGAFGALGLLRLPLYSAAWSRCQEVSENEFIFPCFCWRNEHPISKRMKIFGLKTFS